MLTPLLLDRVGAARRAELATDACWHRALRRARATSTTTRRA